ncbi:MAG: hypothetical protein ACD_41C00365G0004 [uncultured bacterium]|nr:MAG: hypothetical protein ACD_41C00365G0004 [uncultured bacterium]HBY73110.1 hypothetical protein [Candidatus Kerfeldbacteria bacterium]
MKLPQWKKLNRNSWFIIVAALLIVAVWISVIVPAIGRLQQTVQTIADAQTTQSSSVQATANLISALQHKSELTEDIATLNHVFVDRSNPIVFVSRFEELAADYDVTLDLDIEQPTVSTATTPVTPARLGIRAFGNWANILDFMNAIYAEPLALTTEQFSITTPSDTADVVHVSIDALTYWH